MTKKKNAKGWLGVFTTKRGQMYIARTPKQVSRAKRLKWKKLK
jgi:hypothetical protein